MDQLTGDIAGMLLSAICAVHCAATPLFVAALALIGIPGGDSPVVEWAFLAGAVVIGAVTMTIGRRHHRSTRPLQCFAVGFVVLCLARSTGESPVETLLVVSGAGAIIVGHLMNWRLRARCRLLLPRVVPADP